MTDPWLCSMACSVTTTTKVCLLTGASGTIGYSLARALKATSITLQIVIIGRRSPPPSITDVDGKPPEELPYDSFVKISDMTDESLVCSKLDAYFDSLQKSEDTISLNRLDLFLTTVPDIPLGMNPSRMFQQIPFEL